jgi:hypothetical protein
MSSGSEARLAEGYETEEVVMILLDEYGGKTKRGNRFRMQVWQKRGRTFESHLLVIRDRLIFSAYDQTDRETAERLAVKRAERVGY